MKEVLLAFIDQLNSSVAILLLALIAIGILIWKVSAWTANLSAHSEKMSSFDGVKDRVIALEATTDKAVSFGERIVRIEAKIDQLFVQLIPNPFAKANSPISLTPQGATASEAIEAGKTVDRLYPEFKAMIDKDAPTTSYDIQQSAFKYIASDLFDLMEDAETIKLKEFAFKSGVPIEATLTIYQILLRDKYLSEKGIPVSDIDKHDPSKKQA